VNFLASSTVANVCAGGPVFFNNHLIICSDVLPPLYSIGAPLRFEKSFNVG